MDKIDIILLLHKTIFNYYVFLSGYACRPSCCCCISYCHSAHPKGCSAQLTHKKLISKVLPKCVSRQGQDSVSLMFVNRVYPTIWSINFPCTRTLWFLDLHNCYYSPLSLFACMTRMSCEPASLYIAPFKRG